MSARVREIRSLFAAFLGFPLTPKLHGEPEVQVQYVTSDCTSRIYGVGNPALRLR